MTAPKTYKTEAIVLKHADIGEADRLLTLYTPNAGKIRAVARGARRTKSRLGGHVEPLMRCSMVVSRGRTFEIISQAEILESFLPIRRNLLRTAQALYFLELTDAFTAEHAENYPVYRLLLESLRLLERSSVRDILSRYFEIQIVSQTGYSPQLYQCINCNARLEPVTNYFAPGGGGILCPSCTPAEPMVQPISPEALKVLRLLHGGDYPTAARVRLSPPQAQEIRRISQGYVRHLLERDLRSSDFMDHLRKAECRAGERGG